MCDNNTININKHYTAFYSQRTYKNVYPTEFVVRTFLAKYPNLKMEKFNEGAKILDIGCGDGRNTCFLNAEGFEVYGTEITDEICLQTIDRMKVLTGKDIWKDRIKTGRNNSLPFEDSFFDGILACHVCYYCDDGETIADNLKEYRRILKTGGVLICSVIASDAYLLRDADWLKDGTAIVKKDPYNNRNGYRMQAVHNTEEIERLFSECFTDFSFGRGNNNWYGIEEDVFWVVCKSK